jgi:glyoxylase-like metal-dependent hydrolase (beta-lactamase superfamily II)
MKKITDSILYMEADHSRDRPILAAVMGTEKVPMVDAGASRKHSREFLEALESETGRSPDYVVLTHWHWDHSFGLSAVRETGAAAIAHYLCAKKLTELKALPWSDDALDARVREGSEISFCADMIKVEYPGNERNIEIAIPELLFDSSLSIDLGDQTVELRAVVNDHSEDGVLVYIPREKCLFLGDMMAHDLYADPPRYRFERMKELFRTIDEIPALHYVESHGEPSGRERFYRENGILRTIALLAAEGWSRKRIEESISAASHGVLDLFMLKP